MRNIEFRRGENQPKVAICFDVSDAGERLLARRALHARLKRITVAREIYRAANPVLMFLAQAAFGSVMHVHSRRQSLPYTAHAKPRSDIDWITTKKPTTTSSRVQN
jgi:hypothetical protein